ncbi:prepilin-type N-terminal cleavage/methylation domain-containing protein [Psychrobacter alimentarius]|uniref:prepilin-type N-terminal cleavage/methylation domain-containing protein n=1 Tax=Psychrobacter alimentarius TaxID=261164 RepID=UPI00191B200D
MTSSGFTLIELMVTIAVLAIIVSIAAPSISTQLANQRVKSTVSLIENALKEAKAESVIRRQDIRVIYNDSITPRTITIENPTAILNTYSINDRSTINIIPTPVSTVTFRPNRVISGDNDVVYSICDSGSSSETLGQIRVNKIANISTTYSGRCL